MQRTTVSSSNLASVGYDATTETLEIEFQNGAVYQYFSVPVQAYHGLMQDRRLSGNTGHKLF